MAFTFRIRARACDHSVSRRMVIQLQENPTDGQPEETCLGIYDCVTKA